MAFGGVVQARFFGKMGSDGGRRAALTGMLVWLFGKMAPANGLFDMVQTGLFFTKNVDMWIACHCPWQAFGKTKVARPHGRTTFKLTYIIMHIILSEHRWRQQRQWLCTSSGGHDGAP